MPGMNGRGPKGQGSMTGRGAGRCAAGRKNMAEIAANTGQTTDQSNCRAAGMACGGKRRERNSGCGNRKRFGSR